MAKASDIYESLVNEWNNIRHTTEQPVTNDKYEYSNESFRFFWWDAYENVQCNGLIYLFGRSYDPMAKCFKSCCLTIKMPRTIYLLPRTHFKSDPTRLVTMKDVYDEFKDIAVQLGIPSFMSRKVSKRHCFDVNVPRQAEYFQARYPARYPVVNFSAGETYSTIFGAYQSFLEMFLLERSVKGPCWLDVKNPIRDGVRSGRCRFNITCANVEDISVMTIDQDPPPLVVLALRVKTDDTEIHVSKRNIVMLSWVAQEKYTVNGDFSSSPFNIHNCAFTVGPGGFYSNDLDKEMDKCEIVGRCFGSEKQLLEYFVQRIEKVDPDLIVGHDLLDHDLRAIYYRILDLKVTYKGLGRMYIDRQPTHVNFHRQAFVGRLLCDLKLSAQELFNCKTYDLDSLVQEVLKMKRHKVKYSSSNWPDVLNTGISQLLDGAYMLRLIQKMSILSVALSLTNICGNTLARTFLGGRSERNEFLLLHAFHERGYIVPNRHAKEQPWKGRSDKSFCGGLLLQPHAGLYGSYVLLLDFKSLYPNIIREYNICASTILHEKDSDKIRPVDGQLVGVLPQIVASLIEKRDASVNATYKMALKMTANSMFGYLAYPNSRFYSKHLAVYIITKGREILTNTAAMIKGMQHNIIYGDTDSVMVQIDSSNYGEVIEISKLIMSKVNARYTHVQLELDMVFSQLLLLAKKKYAAVCIDDALKLTRICKGLEMVRRDWSNLVAKVTEKVLDYIFNDGDCYTSVMDYIEKLEMSIADHPIEDFTMIRQLSKDLGDYLEVQPMHVTAAKRSKAMFKVGDDVTFMVCDDGTDDHYTKRVYCLEDVLENSENLQPDKIYYLSRQVYPVVRRLCTPIKYFDFEKFTTPLCPFEEKTPFSTIKITYVDAFIFECGACGVRNAITDSCDFLNNCENETCLAKPVKDFSDICHYVRVGLQKRFAGCNEAECTNPCCVKFGVYVEAPNGGPVTCEMCSVGELKVKVMQRDLWKTINFYKRICSFKGPTPHAIYYDKLLELIDFLTDKFRWGTIDMGDIFSVVTPPVC